MPKANFASRNMFPASPKVSVGMLMETKASVMSSVLMVTELNATEARQATKRPRVMLWVDAGIETTVPNPHPGTTVVIPPPGAPGGDSKLQPK